MNSLTTWKMIYGIVLLASLVGLAIMLAIGEIKEESSFGLREIILALALLSQNFSSWAFNAAKENREAKDDMAV